MNNTINKSIREIIILVVISIFVILSAIGIVGYNSYLKKVNDQIDIELCKQYNEVLHYESQFDNNITMSEFVYFIKEHGIRDDMFDTKNKSYLFAYDRTKANTVLIDKNSGDVVYPKKYDSSKSEFWTLLNQDRKLYKGISNYAILGTTLMLDGDNIDLNGTVLKNINLDLNGSVLQVANQANFSGLNIQISNGALVKKSSDIEVTLGENANVIDDTSDHTWGKIFTYDKNTNIRDDINDYATVVDNTLLIENKYFASLNEVVISFNEDNYEHITIRNCAFENISIEAINLNTRFTLVNNNFVNVGDLNTNVITLQTKYEDKSINSYEDFINVSPKFSYEIRNNNFIGCYKGINLTLPSANTSTSRITNNSFNMVNAISNDNEVRSYCIQISSGLSSDDKFEKGVANKINEKIANAFGKLEVKYNKVVNARGLISFHSSLSSFYNDETYGNNINFLKVLESVLTVSDNNTIACFNGLAYANLDKKNSLSEEKLNNLYAIIDLFNN